RETHYFGSTIFLSEGSLIPQAAISQSAGRRRSYAILLRLHCARKFKSRGRKARFLRSVESVIPRSAAYSERCPPKAKVTRSNRVGCTILRRSVPDTWVTVYTGDIGNTLVVSCLCWVLAKPLARYGAMGGALRERLR